MIVIPIIFGVEYRDSASVWMLAGVSDLMTGFAVLPVFIVVQLIGYLVCRSRGKAPLRSAVIAAVIGALVFLPSVVAVWKSQGAKKVLRAR